MTSDIPNITASQSPAFGGEDVRCPKYNKLTNYESFTNIRIRQ